MAEVQHRLENLQKQQKNLKQEILKSMAGESVFDQSVIQEMFEENAQAIASVQKEMETIEQCSNARAPISVTPSGRTMLVRVAASMKA